MKRYITAAIIMILILNLMIPISVCGKGSGSVSGNEAGETENEAVLISSVTGVLKNSVNGYTDILEVSVSANRAAKLNDRAFAMYGPLSNDAINMREEDFTDCGIFEISENGRYCFVLRDCEGSTDRVYSEVDCIDNEAPGITSAAVVLSGGVNGYAKKGVLNIAAYDLKSRLHKEAFSFDDGVTYTDKYSFEVTRNDMYIVRVRDGLGNEVRRVVSVECIDNAGPVIAIEKYENKSSVASVQLKINLEDAGCGISKFYYMDNETGVKADISEFEQTKKETVYFTIAKNGNYTFYAEDALGNATARIISVDNIQKKVPDSSSSVVDNDSIKKDKTTSSSLYSGLMNPVNNIYDKQNEDGEKDDKEQVVINIKSKEDEGKSSSSSSSAAEEDAKDSSRELLMKLLGDDAAEEEEAGDESSDIDENTDDNILKAEVIEDTVPVFYGLDEERVETASRSLSENMAGNITDIKAKIADLKAADENAKEIRSSNIIFTGMGMMTAFIIFVLLFFKKRGMLMPLPDSRNKV